MWCRTIVFVVYMIITVLDARPCRPKKHKFTAQTVTTVKYVKNYTRSKLGGNINTGIINVTLLPAIIAPVDDITTKNKEILHKAPQSDDNSHLLVKPLDIEGVIIGGINDWFILDDYYNDYDYYSEFDYELDEEYYDYNNEYTEEFWEETVFELDMEEW